VQPFIVRRFYSFNHVLLCEQHHVVYNDVGECWMHQMNDKQRIEILRTRYRHLHVDISENNLEMVLDEYASGLPRATRAKLATHLHGRHRLVALLEFLASAIEMSSGGVSARARSMGHFIGFLQSLGLSSSLTLASLIPGLLWRLFKRKCCGSA
jgi:hypothetical protein